jgi:hypothetical protein
MLTPGARGTFLTDAAEAIALGFHWRDEDGPRPWVGQVGQYSFGWASEVRRYPHSGLTVSTAQNGLDVTRYVQPLDRSPFGLVAGFVATWCHDGPHQRPTHPLVWQHGYVAGLRVADRITGLAGCGPISDAEVERMVAGAQRAGTEWAQGFRAAIGATRGIAGDPAAMRDFIAHQAPVPAPLMALDMLAAGGSRAEFGPQTFFTR